MLKFVNGLRGLRRNEQGTVVVLLALSMVAIMGFMGLVVDGGMMYETRRQLQNAVDGAAMAGAWERVPPENLGECDTKAREYSGFNEVSGAEITEVACNINIDEGNPAVRVTAVRPLDLFFAPILGIDTADVTASATAIVAKFVGGGLWPWTVCEGELVDPDGLKTLKFGPSGMWAPGNFGAADYPPTGGASTYGEEIVEGWWDTIPPPVPPPGCWNIQSEPGNMAVTCGENGFVPDLLDLAEDDDPRCNLPDDFDFDNYDFGCNAEDDPDFDGDPEGACLPSTEAFLRDADTCHRIGIIPVILQEDCDDIDGMSSICVMDFATVYLKGCTGGSPGQRKVEAIFIDYAVVNGGTAIPGADLEGVIGARLWR